MARCSLPVAASSKQWMSKVAQGVGKREETSNLIGTTDSRDAWARVARCRYSGRWSALVGADVLRHFQFFARDGCVFYRRTHDAQLVQVEHVAQPGTPDETSRGSDSRRAADRSFSARQGCRSENKGEGEGRLIAIRSQTGVSNGNRERRPVAIISTAIAERMKPLTRSTTSSVAWRISRCAWVAR